MAATMRSARIGERDFIWGARTYVMGIVNVTPDSFSGDGVTDLETAVARARQMERDGADLIDIGGESTRPETWAGPGLSAEEELARVIPVVERVAAAVAVPVSIDTYKAKVAERALVAGARLVNDVWGLRRDPRMAQAVARAGVPVVLMHNKPGGGYHDLIAEIAASLLESVEMGRTAGIAEDRIILDPGIGFGKTREENLEIIRRLPDLRRLGFPLLIGPSRKSFIGKTLDLPAGERLEGTAAAVALAIAGGADIVRVHDVKAMVRVARMADAIRQAGPPADASGALVPGERLRRSSRVWLALGSNLGDRAGYLEAARAALPRAGITVVKASRVAETDPVGVRDQPRFLNQVLEVETSLEPRPLLDAVKNLEQELGRTTSQRWGPREIDIDILTYDGRTVDEVGLHIPHAELQNRPFLLKLLEDLETR
ncbi:MAG TPA: dihydropteroate synthase [Candidatus Binatus sp.]|nr:dihydropteroate synthase [Candidatus Binatus sp.]